MKMPDNLEYQWCDTFHIIGNTVIIVAAVTVYLEWFLVTVTETGTNWTFAIRNKETVPKYLVPAIALAKAGINQQTQLFNTTPPRLFWMEGGMEIVTAGPTPGNIDVWVAYRKPVQ
jgi:hypothetical protein